MNALTGGRPCPVLGARHAVRTSRARAFGDPSSRAPPRPVASRSVSARAGSSPWRIAETRQEDAVERDDARVCPTRRRNDVRRPTRTRRHVRAQGPRDLESSGGRWTSARKRRPRRRAAPRRSRRRTSHAVRSAARDDQVLTARSSSSMMTSWSRNAMDSSASEAASRVRTAMRLPRAFRRPASPSKSDAWDSRSTTRRTCGGGGGRRTRVGPATRLSHLPGRAVQPRRDSEAPSLTARRGQLWRRAAAASRLVHATPPAAPRSCVIGVRALLRRPPSRYQAVSPASRRSPPSFSFVVGSGAGGVSGEEDED